MYLFENEYAGALGSDCLTTYNKQWTTKFATSIFGLYTQAVCDICPFTAERTVPISYIHWLQWIFVCRRQFVLWPFQRHHFSFHFFFWSPPSLLCPFSSTFYLLRSSHIFSICSFFMFDWVFEFWARLCYTHKPINKRQLDPQLPYQANEYINSCSHCANAVKRICWQFFGVFTIQPPLFCRKANKTDLVCDSPELSVSQLIARFRYHLTIFACRRCYFSFFMR